MTKPRKLTRADVALALELRTEGLHWYHIATGLGVHTKTLRSAVEYAEAHGMPEAAAPVGRRNHTLRVQSIAAQRLGIGASTPSPAGGAAHFDLVGAAQA